MARAQARAVVGQQLAQLAELYGVATTYQDQAHQRHDIPEATVLAVLAALGVVVSDEASIEVAIEEALHADWERVLPPVVVHRHSRSRPIWVHAPKDVAVTAQLTTESGQELPLPPDRSSVPRHDPTRRRLEWLFALPTEVEPGWHVLTVRLGDEQAATHVVVTPDVIALPDRGWGLMAQLYSLRSQRSWSLGDLADLAWLEEWAGGHGADFVLVNPMHAAGPGVPMEPSPYLPSTRRFFNPLYLHVESIPEYASLPDIERLLIDELHDTIADGNGSSALLDRDTAWEAKQAALEIIHRSGASPERMQSFHEFVQREGVGLQDFALWCALGEEHGEDFHEWPAGLRDPRSPDVTLAFARLEDRVLFHSWLQWLMDEQLGAAQERAVAAGMAIGIIHDLAVGVHGDGADAWRLGSMLVPEVSVGAPPDMYNQMGQDWSQPPWHPRALAEHAYLPYRDMLRTILRHAGGIRVDHILGMFRQWWIPDGFLPSEGTYVAIDHEAMIGILLLEASRVGAVVIGEDLGTVQPRIRDHLKERGVLGTGVLWFERTRKGIVPPAKWRRAALASVTVHDLPPTAGFIAGEHVRLRADLGLLTRTLAEEDADHARGLAEWVALAQEVGVLAADYDTADLVVALHQLLASSDALLLGVSVTDLAGDVRAQNQPGTNREYPNWCVPLCDSVGRPVLLEDLPKQPLSRRILSAMVDAPAKPPAATRQVPPASPPGRVH